MFVCLVGCLFVCEVKGVCLVVKGGLVCLLVCCACEVKVGCFFVCLCVLFVCLFVGVFCL